MDEGAVPRHEYDRLQQRVEILQETIRAIRDDAIDAVVLNTAEGPQAYRLAGNDDSFRTMIETMFEGAATIDVDGTITYANPQLAQMLRTPLTVLVGSSIADHLTDDSRDRLVALLSGPRTPGVAHDLTLVTADHEPIATRASLTPLLTGGLPELFTLVLVDVSDLLDRTAQLQRSTRDLAQFARAAVHSLQEPLRVIATLSQLIRDPDGELSPTERDEFLKTIEDSALHSRNLVRDLFTFVNTASEPPTQLVNLTELVEVQVRSNFRPETITTSLAPDITVVANTRDIRHLLEHLIGNAQKFVQPGTTPRVRITLERVTANAQAQAHLQISDNGIGIPPSSRHDVFAVFSRLAPSSYPGTGIGLPICRRIAEKHNGEIWVGDRPDGAPGTTIHVTIPALP